MSDTPRTDAVTWSLPEGYGPSREQCPASHARQLEREAGMMKDAGDPALPLWARVRALEKSVILMTLNKHSGNLSAAARELMVSRETLYRKAGELGIGRRSIIK